ncbi:MAG: hypothetical protein HZB67_00720 [Candidatus Aenigmarchaeota archaeon]|nr:hypothetical protein [Candidatus Aenigmarchaeota archaeon]
MVDVYSFFKKYWPIFAIAAIMLLGIYVRTLDYRWPYLRNIDSYLFYRQMDDITKGGPLPDYDPLILAPYGHHYDFFPWPYQYLGAYSYMFTKLFIPGLQLWQYLIYFPPFLAALMAIPMYYIGKTLYDRKAGVLAAFFIVFDIAIMGRSLGGDPDSDAIVMLLPIIIIALFLMAYKRTEIKKLGEQSGIFKKIGVDKTTIILSVLTGVFFGIWAFSWSGWWYVVWLVTGFVIARLIFNYIKIRKPKEVFAASKLMLVVFGISMLVYMIIALPIYGLNHIPATITGPFTFGNIKAENWEFPNVFVSVAELQEPGDAKSIIQSTSAISFDQNPLAMLVSPFFLMIYCLIYLIYSYIKKRQHLDTMLLLVMWFIGPFIATMAAVRFSILFSAPIAIGSAILLAKFYRMISGEDKKFED